MKRKLTIAHRVDLQSREKIINRIRSLKKQLKEADQTKPSFTKDDQALRTYKTVLSARIQELSWVLNDTKLFIT